MEIRKECQSLGSVTHFEKIKEPPIFEMRKDSIYERGAFWNSKVDHFSPKSEFLGPSGLYGILSNYSRIITSGHEVDSIIELQE